MRKNFVLILILLPLISLGQHEVRLSIDGGASWFHGDAASSNTFFISAFSNGYTNNPLGKLPGISYGAAVNYKYISKVLFFGLSTGYDHLETNTKLEHKLELGVDFPIKGKTTLSGDFIRLTPSVGFRIPIKENSLDIGAGLDIQRIVSKGMNERVVYKIKGADYETRLNWKRDFIKTDLRPRFQADLNFGRLGIYSVFSLGIINYYSGRDGSNASGSMNTIKIGASYKLN